MSRSKRTAWLRYAATARDMKKRVSIAVGLVLIIAAAFAGEAKALTTCGYASGTYSNNEVNVVAYSWTSKSAWWGDKDYNAYRYDGDGNWQYHHYQDVSTYGPDWSFDNGSDVWRQTRIQRGGYTSSNYAIWQYAIGGC
jgi:hypothetical protein